jgi:hypothetical protein
MGGRKGISVVALGMAKVPLRPRGGHGIRGEKGRVQGGAQGGRRQIR